MRLVIVGAGAIGGTVAGFLARAQRDVTLVARGAQLAAIREHGLRVETPREAFVVHPELGELRAIAWRADDVVVLAVKTQDVAAALNDVPHGIRVACFTNGIAAERLALREAREVYGGCVYMPTTYLVPGVVQAWAAPVAGAIDVGRYFDGVGDSDAIAAELRAAGLASEARADIMRWKRGKLLSNLANGAEAMSGRGARTSRIAELVRREAIACFAAAGLAVTSDEEEAARFQGFASQPIAGAKRGGGSTWQSLARGARTLETDHLNGEIVSLGRQHGVPTPVNALLQQLAADAARRGDAPGSLPLDELIARVEAVAT